MTSGEGKPEVLTDRARQAIGRADLIARRRGARAIDTHHLLLALVQPGGGLGAEILAEIGLDPRLVARVVERIDGRGRRSLSDQPRQAVGGAGRLLLTRQTERALDLAGEAAQALGHEVIGTEHLLLGLLAQRTGAAAAVLTAMGIRAAEIRRLLVTRLLEGLPGRLKGSAEGPSGRRLGGPEGRFRA